jgi:hypothetical protein
VTQAAGKGASPVAGTKPPCFSRPVSRPGEARNELEAEARLFTVYLVGHVAPTGLVERYVDAIRTLAERTDSRHGGVLAFVRRHPRSLSLLDAASALIDRDGALRSRILVMAAILETSPEFADEFLPRPVGLLPLLLRLPILGLVAGVRALAGVLLYPIASRTRS